MGDTQAGGHPGSIHPSTFNLVTHHSVQSALPALSEEPPVDMKPRGQGEGGRVEDSRPSVAGVDPVAKVWLKPMLSWALALMSG